MVIDNDSLNTTHIAELQQNFTYPLSVTTVESLYYSPEVLASVAEQQAATFGDEGAVLFQRPRQRFVVD